MRLHFCGANRQVTGSSTLLQAGGLNILVDRGMFQERRYDDRNRHDLPIPASELDHVVLTHAHLDHCGLLPRLIRQGYRGPIHTHDASADLAELVMFDSARLQQEDDDDEHERRGRRPGRGMKRAADRESQPLYDDSDVRQTMTQFNRVLYETPVKLSDTVGLMLHEAGHILGSASVQIVVDDGSETGKRFIFSGDIGQDDRPIIRDPADLQSADVLVLESTYGDRLHPAAGDTDEALLELIHHTHRQRGKLIIPSFAIERAQELLYRLNSLKNDKRFGDVRVYLDSPMAAKATQIFKHNPQAFDDEASAELRDDTDLFDFSGLRVTMTRQQSMRINRDETAAVIIAGSGMCTGGRVLHHLKRHLDSPRNTLLFIGYQAHGTLGREIQNAANQRDATVRVLGDTISVRCRIETLPGLSGHADRHGLIDWVNDFKDKPTQVFLNHGDDDAAAALRDAMQRRFEGMEVSVPKYRQSVAIGR